MSHKGVITVWACEWAVCLRLAMRLRPFVVVVIVIITHFNCNRLTNRYKYWILFSSRALANKEMRWSFKKSHLLRFKLELWFFFLSCKNALWNWILCARFFGCYRTPYFRQWCQLWYRIILQKKDIELVHNWGLDFPFEWHRARLGTQ